VPVATVGLAFDGALSRVDGGVLIAIFGVWLTLTTLEARRERSAAVAVLAERSHVRSIGEMVLGLAFLILAGRAIVVGATGVGDDLGVDAFTVGAIFVAIGTSVPELATTLLARIRGHSEVGLGTVVGSNIFNGACVIPLAALIHPITFSFRQVGASIAFGLALVLLLLTARGTLRRPLGVLFLGLYAGYVGFVLAVGPTAD
jgi:cation:H+ antiporter